MTHVLNEIIIDIEIESEIELKLKLNTAVLDGHKHQQQHETNKSFLALTASIAQRTSPAYHQRITHLQQAWLLSGHVSELWRNKPPLWARLDHGGDMCRFTC